MPATYKGDDGVDIVHQNNNNGYYNIYTYGSADEVYLTLNKTLVETGSGNDYVKSNIEDNNTVYLGNGNDTYIGNGYSNRDNHYDIVYGGNGNDTISVATAVSEYYGDDGNDTFKSAGYWNYFNGGEGRDTISYQRQDSDNYLSGRGVKVNLDEHYATTGGGREETLKSIENVTGTSYDDTLIGANDANTLQGMDGNDVVSGRNGNDVLYGGNGGDNLFGGKGQDTLYGGKGQDVLNGDENADVFVFQSAKDSVNGKDRDVIADFSRSEGDKIDVSDIGSMSFSSSDSFSKTAGEMIFKDHILYGDTNGDGKSDFQIEIENVGKLHVSDFIF
jgi:Ca2+-binding RTX toxin-like protein